MKRIECSRCCQVGLSGRERLSGVIRSLAKVTRWACRALVLSVVLLATVAVAGPAWGAKPLSAPKTSPVKDSQYLLDVTKADPALGSYVQQRGNVALRALLTDGAAFCAFLSRGGGIDAALTSVAIGAKRVESTTHLPMKVVTFNTMEAVALLTFCPSDQKLLPASDRSNVRALGRALSK
jgi:hypothetical protein